MSEEFARGAQHCGASTLIQDVQRIRVRTGSPVLLIGHGSTRSSALTSTLWTTPDAENEPFVRANLLSSMTASLTVRPSVSGRLTVMGSVRAWSPAQLASGR